MEYPAAFKLLSAVTSSGPPAPVSVSDTVASHTAGVEFALMDIQEDIQCDSSESDQCFSTSDIVLNGLSAAAALDSGVSFNSSTCDAVMNEVMTLPVFTVAHVPKSVRPLLAEVLSTEFRLCATEGVLGFMRLYVFPKSVLRVPPRGGKKKRHLMKSLLTSRLKQWQSGNFVSLWLDARSDASSNRAGPAPADVRKSNARRSIKLAREGRYGDAIRSLLSQGCASHNDCHALYDLTSRHPDHELPIWSKDIPPSLVIENKDVPSGLQAFPRGTGTSPGGSQLRAQHLLDAISGTIVPTAQTCLNNLTFLMNTMLAGKLPTCTAPWLVGAPLTALRKKS